MLCQNCKNEIEENAKFCPYCGKGVEMKKFCSSCGAELREGQKYCPNCGTETQKEEPSQNNSKIADAGGNGSGKEGNLIKKFACSSAVGERLSSINNVSGFGYIYNNRIEFHTLLFKPDIYLIQDIAELSVRKGAIYNSLTIRLKSGRTYSLHPGIPKSSIPEEVVHTLSPYLTK